jgi:acyl-CoA thioesterase
MPLAPLDAALLLEKTADRAYQVHTSSTYWNIAGPFGGWVFAAGAKAILLDAELIGEPVEAHARFLAGPKSGLINIKVTRQSQGRSVAFWRAELTQPHNGRERLCAEVSLLVASERDTIDVVTAIRPDSEHPDGLRSINSSKGQLRWLDVYDVRYVSGKPFKPQSTPSMKSLMWARERETRPLDWLGIIAVADIPAPRTFLLQPGVVPTSTVSMSVYFTASAAELATPSDDWLLMDIDGHTARHGFFDHSVSIWRGDKLIATSTQLAWFS